MKRVILAAAVAMCFAPAYAANQTYTVDLVVVGAGAGGSVAALSAVEGGLKTLLLEKNAFAGGAGNFMEGSFAAESFMQKEAGVKLQIGFCRRFDHNHRAVYDMVRGGKVGKVNIIKISSRDPEPPPVSYVKVSGGIFYDMMIHDFDMVRYVPGSEAVEISAVGSCLVNPKLQEESGIPDVDTAVVTMKMANGCIAVINNSRQAVYGYDQRVEAFGSKGMASDANDLGITTTVMTVDGAKSEKPLWFFLERYNQSFINQVISFVDASNNDMPVAVGAVDGLRPGLMAKAATESCRNGGVYVKVEE